MADALLSLNAVSKSYWRGPSEVRVLSDASLEVREGEFTGVWGRRRESPLGSRRPTAGLFVSLARISQRSPNTVMLSCAAARWAGCDAAARRANCRCSTTSRCRC